MRNIWFISDTHFGHENILKFVKYSDGSQLRPFASLKEMNECIFDNWARVVKPQDKIYHLGDLAFGKEGAKVLSEMKKLPGHKRLVMGNHDKLSVGEYRAVFEQVLGAKRLDDMWLTHIPVHPHSIAERKVLGNAHGHLHDHSLDDPRYVCCSVEQLNYVPIHYEVVRDRMRKYNVTDAVMVEMGIN